jgi:hypothetical protein
MGLFNVFFKTGVDRNHRTVHTVHTVLRGARGGSRGGAGGGNERPCGTCAPNVQNADSSYTVS